MEDERNVTCLCLRQTVWAFLLTFCESLLGVLVLSLDAVLANVVA
jgi:hypothetical protein